MISATGLGYRYRRRWALEDVTLTIGPGITTVLGPNGAGKSTLLSLIATRRAPTVGGLEVLGNDVRTLGGRESVRRRLGYLQQRYPLVGSMRVADTVAYAGWAQGLARSDCYAAAADVLRTVGIASLSDRRVRTLSGGQRQRVGLATAMVHRPRLLLLDEPTVGLDPEIRLRLRETLIEIAQRATVLLATHMIEDVAALSDDVVVLADSRIAFQGPKRDLEGLAPAVGDAVGMRAGSMLEQGYSAALSTSRTP